MLHLHARMHNDELAKAACGEPEFVNHFLRVCGHGKRLVSHAVVGLIGAGRGHGSRWFLAKGRK